MGRVGNNNLGPGGGGVAAGGSGRGRGDGGEGLGRLRRRYNHNPQNPGSGKLRDAPQRCSPGQPANRGNRPPVQANRPHASGYGPPRTPKQGQLGVVAARGRGGGALAPSPSPTTRPPQRGNHSIEDSRAFTKSWRAFNFSFEWWPRMAVSFSYSS